MDIETMPHAMYFTGDPDTVTKINQVPYQTIEYNNNGMFTTKLMNDTPIEIFIDNGTTPSILPLRTYNKFPIFHTYPKTKSNTPIHTGGGLITSHGALVCLWPFQAILGWARFGHGASKACHLICRRYIVKRCCDIICDITAPHVRTRFTLDRTRDTG